MSVPAEEMRRRVPVARPVVQQLALPAPAPAAPTVVPQLGTPAPTIVPSNGTVATAGPGQLPSLSQGMRPPGAAAAMASPVAAPQPIMYGTPGGAVTPEPNVARSLATRERMATGRPAPTAAGLPPSTPAAQVQFAPNPRTPDAMPGARPAAAAMGATPAPAAAAAPVVGPDPGAGGQPRRPMSSQRRAAGAAGAGLEAINVIGAANEGGIGAGVREAGGAATRLGTAAAGAQLGGMLGPWGAAAGGIIGYAGGDQLVQQFEDPNSSLRRAAAQYGESRPLPAAPGGGMFMAPSQIAAGQAQGIRPQAAAEQLRAPVPPAPGTPRPDFSNVVSGANTTSGGSELTPEGGRGGIPPGGRVEITDNGNTRVIEGDELAAIGQRANVVPAFQAPERAAQALSAPTVGGPNRFADGERRQHMERIDKLIQDIGPMDRRGRRDAVTALMGLRGRAVEGNFNASNEQAQLQAQLAQRSAESQLGADVDREQIAASSANARQQRTQTITGADGTVYAVDGTTAQPLTTGDGQPLRGVTKQDDTLQKLAAELLQGEMSAAAQNPLSQFDPNAAVQRAASAATMLQQATSAPQGYTYAGTQNGVAVYRDAQGNLIQPNSR